MCFSDNADVDPHRLGGPQIPGLTAPAQQRHRSRMWLLALPCCLLLLAAGAPAAHGAALEKGFWGPSQIDGKSQFPIYGQLGVTIYQTQLHWSNVASTRPANPRDHRAAAYRWPADIDYVVSESRRHGMKVLILVTGSPPWANGGRSSEYAPEPSERIRRLRSGSRQALPQRPIWGEPSRSNNWKPLVQEPFGAPMMRARARAPRRYARLLDAAYGQLKAQRRSNLVIGGNTYTTGDIRPVDWVRHMKLPSGRPPRMDRYGHNPFSLRNPNLRNPAFADGVVDFSDLGRFDRLIQRVLGRPRRKRVRLFLSEFTIPTALDNELNFHVSLRT